MTKIMLVDDEPDVSFLVTKILGKNGYNVVEVKNGKDCLKRVKEEKPDLILMDIMMPQINGWEVSRKLKTNSETKNIPIVMLTVRVSDDSVEKSFEYALADAHIGKPMETDYMLQVIEKTLSNNGGAS